MPQCFPQLTVGEKREVRRSPIKAATNRQAGAKFIDDPFRALVFEEFHSAATRGKGCRRVQARVLSLGFPGADQEVASTPRAPPELPKDFVSRFLPMPLL